MLLAALPATPVQLAHACYQLGYEVVVPASWGDELVARAVLDELRQRDRAPAIQCTCPLAAERLSANGAHLEPSLLVTAPPPVAAARYARRAFAPRALHVTYIGACPGAVDAAIDERLLPDEFLRFLGERDIALSDMPTVFDSVLPPDRRRYLSLPGGCPSQEALWEDADGRMLREVAPSTFATDLAQILVWREHVMVDVAPALGCACAGGVSRLGARHGRIAVMAVEPPRAAAPVIVHQPEFTQPSPPAAAPPLNGRSNRHTAPIGSVPERDAAPHSSTAESSGPREASATAVRSIRRLTPARASALLPRAYLAKRRRVGAHHVTEDAATFPAVAEADDDAASPAPNESDERARPIAVHVEPDVDTTDADAQPLPDLPPTASEWRGTAPSPAPQAATLDPLAPGVPTVPPLVPEERPSEVAAETPLRVEVEIYEEETASVPVIEPVAAHAASESDVASVAADDPPTDSLLRRWGDLLIAVWLLLVASAVLATLLWRR